MPRFRRQGLVTPAPGYSVDAKAHDEAWHEMLAENWANLRRDYKAALHRAGRRVPHGL
jgi:hypothetical protein